VVVYWSFRGLFQRLCLVSAFIDTNKNKWFEKRAKPHFFTYCFMVKTNISKYKGAAIYLAGVSLKEKNIKYLPLLTI
jgi:hypothetical protein